MGQIKKSFALILFFSFLFSATIVDAGNGETYEVSPTVLHVRDEPAKTGAIVGVLQKGDQVQIFAEKHGWAQTYYAGNLAWVAKHHLFPTNQVTESSKPTAQTKATDAVTITSSNVVIRSGPGQEYDPIASASMDSSYQVVDSSGEWLQIQLHNGNTGWVARWLTSEQSSARASESTNGDVETNAETVATPVSTSLAGYNIVIDAGHGGRDPGAIGLDGIQEKELVTPTASTIANTLRQYGATVIETRTGDYYLPLDQRAHISNNYFTDAFLSIHYDSFPVLSIQGVSAYYNSDDGRVLAQSVQQSIAAAVPLENRGIRQENFRVLRHTNAPAILLELGFITNPYDLSHIKTADYQNRVAEAIANGLMNYFNR